MSDPTTTPERRAQIPSHVPDHLVQPSGSIMYQAGAAKCPYDRLSEMHGGPRVLYRAPSSGPFSQPGAWVLTLAEDIRAVMQQPEIFSSKGLTQFPQLGGEHWDLIPIEVDPPMHGKYRVMLNPVFSPKAIDALEPGIRARAASLVDGVVKDGQCEFVEAFGRPFPVSIFMQIMGLPDADMDELNEWEHGLLHSPTVAQRQAGARGFLKYLRGLVAERRAQPMDDLAGFTVLAELDGRALTDDEVMGVYYLMVVAGLDTVAASLGLHFRHLAQDLELQSRLRADPSLIPDAVEELLRRYSIVTTNRTVTQDVEMAGVAMKKGDKVTCSTILASLDPAEFENPMAVDISRSPNRHVAFSYGPHRCLGSHLARRELTVAMEEWLDRVPEFRMKDGADAPVVPGQLLSVDALPLAWSV
jgi:cytochrome P450